MKKLIPVVTLIVGAAVALPTAFASGGVAIATEQIASAISSTGMSISPRQVTLLTEVQATISTPALKVESMERVGGSRTMVRLSCTNAEQCLPFFVSVRGVESTGQSIAVNARSQRARRPAEAVVMRSGSPATLFIDGDRVHIQLAVICVENGTVGQMIRVTSKDRKMTYQAEIVDGTTLRGRL